MEARSALGSAPAPARTCVAATVEGEEDAYWKAVRYVDTFRHACISAAKEARVDGVICGHIHRADLRQCEGILYCNDGDWVESCTAIAEDQRRPAADQMVTVRGV